MSLLFLLRYSYYDKIFTILNILYMAKIIFSKIGKRGGCAIVQIF